MLPRDLRWGMEFARFARELEPYIPRESSASAAFVAARIIQLARGVFRAGVRSANMADAQGRLDSAYKRFAAYVRSETSLGYSLPGLWPTLTAGGQSVRIPSE